jgi:hypothetical protein
MRSVVVTTNDIRSNGAVVRKVAIPQTLVCPTNVVSIRKGVAVLQTNGVGAGKVTVLSGYLDAYIK